MVVASAQGRVDSAGLQGWTLIFTYEKISEVYFPWKLNVVFVGAHSHCCRFNLSKVAPI